MFKIEWKLVWHLKSYFIIYIFQYIWLFQFEKITSLKTETEFLFSHPHKVKGIDFPHSGTDLWHLW